MLLVYLTVAVAAGVVLALAGYLIGIAWALMQARRNVAQLATTLEAVAEATRTLPRTIEDVDDAVGEIVEALPIDVVASDIAGPADREISAANL